MNNNYSEEEIRNAAQELILAMAEEDASKGSEHVFSGGFETRMQDLISNQKKQNKRNRTIRRIAAIAAALLVVIGVLAIAAPETMASVFNWDQDLYGDVDLETLYVAQLPEECITACDIFLNGNANGNADPRSGITDPVHTMIPIVARVRVTGKVQNILNAYKQHYIVEEVFRGSGIKAGDEIMLNRHMPLENYYYEDDRPFPHYPWITELDGDSMFEVVMHFSNLMIPEEDYLVFIQQLSPYSKGHIKTYDLADDLAVPSIFSYSDLPSEAVSGKTIGNSTYVKYTDVMDNQFFGMSEKTLDELEGLRKELIAIYQTGSGIR